VTAPFERTGLLQRLRATPIEVADLHEVADAVLPGLATDGLRIAVDDRRGRTAVVLDEDGLRRRVALADLAEDMTDAGVPPTREGMAAALASWVAHRPATEAAALGCGVAVLDWTGSARTAVGWTVAVPRGSAAVTWRPDAGSDPRTVERIRSAALRRAADVPLALRLEGPVAIWSHPRLPLLATAVLAHPERLLARVAEAGLEIPDMHVVVTPHRPVACTGAGVAARLAGQANEDLVTVPWRELAALPWQ
jgi:hypothetical protein